MPCVSNQGTRGIKLGVSPSTSSADISTLNVGKLEHGVKKWPSTEEVWASRQTPTVPPAAYFRNRRSSLPANTLSVRPRTSLSDVFTSKRANTAEETTVQTLNLSEKTNSASFQRMKRTFTLAQNCQHLAELMKARSEAISRLSKEDSSTSSDANSDSVDKEQTDSKAPGDKKQVSY